MKKAEMALTCCVLVGGCQPQPEAFGWIQVPQPDGTFQKIFIQCRRSYYPGSREITVSGISIPVTSVIKPQIGGISTRETADSVSDKLLGLDLQQAQVFLALSTSPDQTHKDQIYKEWIGANGQFRDVVQSLADANTESQYKETANKLEKSKVSDATAAAADAAK